MFLSSPGGGWACAHETSGSTTAQLTPQWQCPVSWAERKLAIINLHPRPGEHRNTPLPVKKHAKKHYRWHRGVFIIVWLLHQDRITRFESFLSTSQWLTPPSLPGAFHVAIPYTGIIHCEQRGVDNVARINKIWHSSHKPQASSHYSQGHCAWRKFRRLVMAKTFSLFLTVVVIQTCLLVSCSAVNWQNLVYYLILHGIWEYECGMFRSGFSVWCSIRNACIRKAMAMILVRMQATPECACWKWFSGDCWEKLAPCHRSVPSRSQCKAVLLNYGIFSVKTPVGGHWANWTHVGLAWRKPTCVSKFTFHVSCHGP